MSSRLQQAETEGKAPLAAVIPKRPVAEASWVPSGRTKKQTLPSKYNPQGPAAQLKERLQTMILPSFLPCIPRADML